MLGPHKLRSRPGFVGIGLKTGFVEMLLEQLLVTGIWHGSLIHRVSNCVSLSTKGLGAWCLNEGSHSVKRIHGLYHDFIASKWIRSELFIYPWLLTKQELAPQRMPPLEISNIPELEHHRPMKVPWASFWSPDNQVSGAPGPLFWLFFC